MIRSFDSTPVNQEWLDELCAQALWSPTAGNTAGVRMYTVGAHDVNEYFTVATDAQWRATARRAAGLRGAGAVVLITSRPQDYEARYREPDKASSGLHERAAWTIPYWHTDAAMATMSLLLLLEESGWQACLWGNFRHEVDVLHWAGVENEELFASILVGRADGHDVTSASSRRDVLPRRERVRRVP